MAVDNNYGYKLKLACSQIGVEWLKDVAKISEEKAWAKSSLINVSGQLDEYLTVAGAALGLTKDTAFAEAGINFLETAGLLAAGRAAEVLDTNTITEIERWNPNV